MPDAVEAAVASAVGPHGIGTEAAWEVLRENVLPFGVGNVHPRFMGWVHGAGTPGGLVASLAEAAINANLGGRNTGAARVERTVLEWARGAFGFPDSASGILTSGTSMATVIALAAARQALADWDVEADGLGAEGARFRVYASHATHGCVTNALRLLGMGRRAFREVPTDGRGHLDLAALRDTLAEDRAAGLRPLAVVGNAGTVDVGAIDDLDGIADVCDAENVWFHVDGAFGALAVLSDALRPRLAGIHRADSIAFDFHKWMHVTYDCGCVLIRNETHHRAAFRSRPEYLEGQASGLAAGEPWFCDYGPELSRGFARAEGLVPARPSTAATRWRGPSRVVGGESRLLHGRPRRPGAGARADGAGRPEHRVLPARARGGGSGRAHAEVVAEVQKRGIAAPSTTRHRGHAGHPCCPMNHRATPPTTWTSPRRGSCTSPGSSGEALGPDLPVTLSATVARTPLPGGRDSASRRRGPGRRRRRYRLVPRTRVPGDEHALDRRASRGVGLDSTVRCERTAEPMGQVRGELLLGGDEETRPFDPLAAFQDHRGEVLA